MTLFLSPPFDRLWSGKDPFAAVERLEGEVFRSIEGRRTIRTEIDGRGFFVKIHRGIGWREIVKNFFFMRLPVLGAGNEWRAIRRLECLGVPTMTPVAYGCRGCNPAKLHSFIITEDLSPVISLEDFTRNWATTPPASAVKRDLINEVARISRIMHAGGVNHRDFYLCHFMLRVTGSFEPGRLPLVLIDLHRAQVRKRVPRRWRDKDLSGLYFSALEIGLSQRDLLRFLRSYYRVPLRDLLRREKRSLARLQHKALRLQRRYQRKCWPLSS